jgi:hypothetical protein
MSSSVKKKLQIKGGILIRHVCRDVTFCKEKTTNHTTLDLYFFLYRRWHPYKHVLSRYYPWFVDFSLQKMTSLQTCLIKILPLICSFFSTEEDIPTNMSYQDTTLDKKLQIKGSVLIRHVCRDVIFCNEKITHQG